MRNLEYYMNIADQLIAAGAEEICLKDMAGIGQPAFLGSSLQLKSESINTWKNGVERALKKYITDGTEVQGVTCLR